MRKLRRKMPDGTSWPTLEESGELEWRLRYGGAVSREDALGAAAYLDAYRSLVHATEARRRVLVRELRKPRALNGGGHSDG